VRIEFYFDEHPPPHIHARYAEFIAQLDIASLDIIKGSPASATVADGAAVGSRRAQLLAVWDACAAGRNPGRIA
jgi:hypothetical protein